MRAIRFDDLKQYSDVVLSRSGAPVTVRFLEPGDAEELQTYFRSLSTRSRYNRFLGAMKELPHQVLDRFIHIGESDGFSVVATMQIDGFATIVGEARYAFHTDTAKFSNSACRSTIAGRATALALPYSAIWNAGPPRSARRICSATPCAPTTP